ncbi:glycosyltransferase [Staphylococcus lloydii]|nr:nucleotide disphospho-sugar-binding domain-containing protein [Staphylococcus lloydii]MDU9418842.1 glycosyltransferase [Staphylococcus lloydii]
MKEHVEQTYNVKIPSRHEVVNNPGDFNISFVTKGFQLDYDAFDSTKFNFVGPSVLPPKPSGFMDNVNTNRPLIYVSLGTVFNQNVAFFNKCFSALANIDATVIVSIGKTNNAEDFDTIPDNVIIKDYVPQVEVLQHADLFLTHAGMNSTNEAIMLNVPLLAFPQSADQPVVANQIENLKIGQQLDADSITAEQLANTVKDMLAHRQTYQQNIEQVKNVQTHKQPGYELGAQAILDFYNKH